MNNFKVIIASVLNDITLKLLPPRSVQSGLFRELGIAAEIVRLGEARKKKAKKSLLDQGLIHAEYKPGTEVIFDESDIVVTAETKEPAVRLDQDKLRELLISRHKLTAIKVAQLIADCSVENKPATSFKVEAK